MSNDKGEQFERLMNKPGLTQEMTLNITLPVGELAIVAAHIGASNQLAMKNGERIGGMPSNIAHIVQVADKFRDMLIHAMIEEVGKMP